MAATVVSGVKVNQSMHSINAVKSTINATLIHLLTFNSGIYVLRILSLIHGVMTIISLVVRATRTRVDTRRVSAIKLLPNVSLEARTTISTKDIAKVYVEERQRDIFSSLLLVISNKIIKHRNDG
jgi:hypothetical protein